MEGIKDGKGQPDSVWVLDPLKSKDGNNVDIDYYYDQYGNEYLEVYQHNDHDRMEDYWYEEGGEYWSGYWS